MWSFNYSDTAQIDALLKANGLYMTRRFGQNFLINSNAIDAIVQSSGADKNQTVWEIGPGIGALSSALLKTGCRLTAFEIDRGFCKILNTQAFADEKNWTLIEGDALKTWEQYWKENGTPDLICANLPYNVGSVLIANLIEKRCLPKTMVFTLQSEVVDRICAKDSSDEQYGGFSILMNTDYTTTNILNLKSGSFHPRPKIASSVVKMTLKENRDKDFEELAPVFFKTVRAVFSQRRKTVKNNLRQICPDSTVADNILTKCNINTLARAEELSEKNLKDLASVLKDLKYIDL